MTSRHAERSVFLAVFTLLLATWIAIAEAQTAPRYLWPGADTDPADILQERIAPPAGFKREPVEPGSFAEWLRNLPLRPPQTQVRLYDGRPKWSQDKHVAVINIDTGNRDLQQCADAIMRLRAEYQLATGQARQIAFNYTNGKRVRYRGAASDRKAFRRYMIGIFAYAGTYSLEREMQRVPVAEMQIGDVFIKGGFPGHAVLVADMVRHPVSGERRFLLLQSYMPAQDMHILTNPGSQDGTPWYTLPGPKEQLVTPEWIFEAKSLRRFAD